MKSKRSKATDVSQETRDKVKKRDKWCIFCGRPGKDMAHVIPRSSGGLGIEQNIVFACRNCHNNMDFGASRQSYIDYCNSYLSKKYDNFNQVKKVWEYEDNFED